MKQLLFCAAAIIMLATSCSTNYEKTPSGLLYKIYPGKEGGVKLKSGQFAKLNLEFSMPEKGKNDTILNSTYGHVPTYAPIDTGARSKYSIMEVLSKCSIGDSLECILSVDSLKNLGQIPDYTPVFKRGDVIHCKGKVLGVFNKQEELMADYQKESKLESARETKELQDYVSKKGIKTQATENGVLVDVQNPGDQSMKADTGKQVSVMYRGSLASTGKAFDSNMDTTFHHTDPFVVVIGRRGSIPGMEEGLKLFGKGGKGTLYIPAMLGYGPQGSPPTIPPYSNLVFDVQVTDVKIAPPPPAPQQNPFGNLTPQQMQELQKRMQEEKMHADSSKHK